MTITRALYLTVCLAFIGCVTDDSEPDPGAELDLGVPAPDEGPEIDGAAPEPDAAPPDMAPPDMALPDVALADMAPPPPPLCANEADDDGDGVVDLDDPGCTDAEDEDEADPPEAPACANGVDDDDDGLIDYPADPDCAAAGAESEGALCASGSPVELPLGAPTPVLLRAGEPVSTASCDEGAAPAAVAVVTLEERAQLVVTTNPPVPLLMFARRSCRDRLSEIACRPGDDLAPLTPVVDEPGPVYIFVQPLADTELPREVTLVAAAFPLNDACRNGIDDDGDGRADQADPGCSSPDDPDETDPQPLPACGDGVDNDGDGATDWPDDPDCRAAGGLFEGLACGGADAAELGIGRHELVYEFDSADAGETRGSCGGSGAEQVAVLAVDRPASLSVAVRTDELATIATYLRTDCFDRATETLCDSAFTERTIDIDRIEVGTYFLFFDHDVGFDIRQDRVEAEVVLTALEPRACENGLDDDEDGLVDAADPGCARAGDDDELDPGVPPACIDGVDNDMNAATDYPEDAVCRSAGSAAEGSGCSPTLPVVPVGDQGGRFLVDPRPFDPGVALASCGGDLGAETVFRLTLTEPADVEIELEAVDRFRSARVFARAACDALDSEISCNDDGPLRLDRLLPGTYYVFVELGEIEALGPPPTAVFTVESLIRECNDEVDNDEDDRVDRADPGCENLFDDSEQDPEEPPVCADGEDNDGDGLTDWPEDPECVAAGAGDEALSCPGIDELIIVPPEGGEFETDTSGLDDVYQASCAGNARGGEAVLVLDLDAPSQVTVQTVAADYDTSLFIRSSCDDDARNEIACDDDGGVRTLSRIETRLEAGYWYVFVDGYARSSGEARVQVGIVPVEE